MGDFVEDMDLEKEQKDKKIQFLENKNNITHFWSYWGDELIRIK